MLKVKLKDNDIDKKIKFMKTILEKIEGAMLSGVLTIGLVWITLALTVQLFFVYLQFSGQEERVGKITREVSWKIDGAFKSSPDNIWYEGSKK